VPAHPLETLTDMHMRNFTSHIKNLHRDESDALIVKAPHRLDIKN